MIELEEEIEGERLETSDFFFDKVGEAVPVKPSDHIFDPETLPSHPLAVSERHGLVFVAHSNGFCVARTKDVVESAKEIKRRGTGSSIQELSVVDVHIGRVHILSLSAGSSTLSACVNPGEIHFFLVKSLLGKDQKPIFSCSINESCSVKAMQWNKKLENSYIVLSEQGNLYHGSIKETLKNVKDNVDAVEVSVDGNFVAVAQENVVVILSSKFEERVSLSLPVRPLPDDSDVSCVLKGGSVWIVSF